MKIKGHAMDHLKIEGATDGAMIGSGRNRRDWMVQALTRLRYDGFY